jgi:hypothetical protein
MATEETTITELELAEEVLADMVIPVDTSTDTKSVSLKQLRAWLGSSLPTGFILPAVGIIDDERFTLLDGKTLSKQGTYRAFCAKVEKQVQASNWYACTEEEYNADLLAYGQCGKFVIGTDYVRIPTITRFIGATITLSEIGKTYKESLPNITDEFTTQNDKFCTGTGAFVASGNVTRYTVNIASGGSGANGESFDASRSSSTYQNGAKVQPDHTKYPYYMVISTEGQTAEVQIDINKVYEDLNIKANSDLSNVTANIDFVVESYNDGANWYRLYKSGWIEQGGSELTYVNIKTINLLKPYKDDSFKVLTTGRSLANRTINVDARTSNTIRVACRNYTDGTSASIYDWFSCGQGA